MADVAVLRALLEADAQAFNQAVDAAEARLTRFGSTARPLQLSVDTRNANRAIDSLDQRVGNLTNNPHTVQINANVSPQADQQLTAFERRLEAIQRRAYYQIAAGSAVTSTITRPVFEGATFGIKSAIDFETAFTGVEKTVEGTANQLERIKQTFREMSAGDKAIPTSFEKLSKIGENAGQLGIATGSIAKFTRVMADLDQTTDLSSDKAADTLARLANITGMSHDNFDRLGATLVDLGNKFAGTESEIASMSLRIAGAGKQVGLTEAEIMSFATALVSVGLRAEMGGNSISRVFLEANKAVRSGGEELDTFAKTAGMSSEQFRKAFSENAAKATMAFLEGLKRINDTGGNATIVIEKLFGTQIRLNDVLTRTSGAGNLLARALRDGNAAWQENTALTAEAEKRYKTTASQLQIFQNRVKDVAAEVSENALPVINELVGAVGTELPRALNFVSKAWGDLPPGIQQSTAALGAFLLLAGPAQVMSGNLKLLGVALRTMSGIGGTSGALTFAVANPVITIAAITALVVAGKALKETYDQITEAQEKVAQAGKKADESLTRALDIMPANDKRRKQIEDLRSELSKAGTDVGKLDEVIKKLVQAEKQVKLKAKTDIDEVVAHDIQKAINLAKQQKLQIQAEVLMKPVWQTTLNNMFRDLQPDANGRGAGDWIADQFAGTSNGLIWLMEQGVSPDAGGIISEQDRREAKARADAWRRARRNGLTAIPDMSARPNRYGLPTITLVPDEDQNAEKLRAKIIAQRKAAAAQKANQRTTPTGHDETEEERRKREAAALKLEKDMLADNAKRWEMYAKSVEDAARRQIEALTKMRDALRGVFDPAKNRFAEMGIVNDPIGATIAQLERIVNIGAQARMTAKGALNRMDSAMIKAGEARSQSDLLKGGDGTNPGYLSSSPLGQKIAAEAARIQAKYGDAIGRTFAHQCDRLADTTVRNVTDKYNKFMGPGAGRGSAAQTMAGFKRAGVGFAPGKDYSPVPGDIVYSGSKYGGGAGHVMIVGPDGKFLDQYGANRKPKTRPEWVVRPDGGSAGGAGLAGAGAPDIRKELSQQLMEALKFDGGLSTLHGLPKNWGPGVKNAEGNAARFAMQGFLMTKEGQEFVKENAPKFEALKKAGPPEIKEQLKQYKDFWDFLRKITNEIDVQTNAVARKQKLDKESTEFNANLKDRIALLELERQMIQAGTLTAEQRNDALEIEAQRLERIRALMKDGHTEKEATGIANSEAKRTANAKAQERSNKVLDDEKRAIKEVDNSIAMLNETTIQQIAYRKAYLDEATKGWSKQAQDALYWKLIAQAIGEVNKEMREAARNAQRQVADDVFQSAIKSPVEAMRHAFTMQDFDKLKKDPDYKPDKETLLFRDNALRTAQSKWDADSIEGSEELLKGLPKQTEITFEAIEEIIKTTLKNIREGVWSEAAMLDPSKIEELKRTVAQNVARNSAKDLMSDPAQRVKNAASEMGRSLDDLRDRNLSPLEKQLKSLAKDKGLFDSLVEQLVRSGLMTDELRHSVAELNAAYELATKGAEDFYAEQKKANFEDRSRSMGNQIKALGVAPGRARDLLTRRLELEEAIRKDELTAEDAGKLMQDEIKLYDAEKLDQKRQDVMQRWRDDAYELKGIFNDAITAGFENGAKAGAQTLLQNIRKAMLDRASDMLATSLTNKIFGKDVDGGKAVKGASAFSGFGNQPNPYLGLASMIPVPAVNQALATFTAQQKATATTGPVAVGAGVMNAQNITINAQSATINAPLAPGSVQSTQGAPTASQQTFQAGVTLLSELRRGGLI